MNVHLGTTKYPKSISNINLVVIGEEKYFLIFFLKLCMKVATLMFARILFHILTPSYCTDRSPYNVFFFDKKLSLLDDCRVLY